MTDEGDALLRLCALLHTRPDLLKSANGSDLFRFATVCNQFDVISVVKALVSGWFD